jgi:hypothetical protein
MTIKATIPTWSQLKHNRYFNNRSVVFQKSFYNYTFEEQYEIFSLNVIKVSEYKYNNAADKQYGIDDIFLNSSDNRFIQYISNNQQHFVDCVKFVEQYKNFKTPSSGYTKIYYNLAKKFSQILDI